jgi:hypothetical protein
MMNATDFEAYFDARPSHEDDPGSLLETRLPH